MMGGKNSLTLSRLTVTNASTLINVLTLHLATEVFIHVYVMSNELLRQYLNCLYMGLERLKYLFMYIGY